MKIAWQAYDRKDYTAGPIVNSVRLLPELVKRGHEVCAIIGNIGGEHPNADFLRSNGVTVINYEIPYYSKEHVMMFLNHVSVIKPDVFVSNISVQAGLAGRWIREWGIPVVHTIRSEDALNIGMSRFFFGKESEWNLDGLVSVNAHLLGLIRAESQAHFSSSVIPSGVPLSEYPTANNKGPLRVVYAGRLSERQKRIFKVLDYFVFAATSDHRLSFSIIGSGEESVGLELEQKIAEKGLSHRISIYGRRSGEAYHSFLRDHDVVVIMSDYEGIPGSLMDGMACGLIPVSTPINGIDELIENNENGFFVNSMEEFLAVLKTLVGDSCKREALSRNAWMKIVKSFSLETTATKWESLLGNLPNLEAKRIAVPRNIDLPSENTWLLEHRVQPKNSRFGWWKNKMLKKFRAN